MALIDFISFSDIGVLRIEKDVSGASTFYGFAKQNSAGKENAQWLIARETVSGLQTELIWASEKFDKVWNDRVSLFGTPPFSNDLSVIFRGGNQHVNIGDVSDLNFTGAAAFSISAWFRTVSNAQQAIISKQGGLNNAGWRLVQNSGRIEFHLAGSGGDRFDIRTDNLSLSDDNWHHVLVTYDGGQADTGVLIYVDGVDSTFSSNQDNTLVTSSANSDNAQIGIRNDSVNDFDGFIDEVAVWNLELASSEALSVYNSGVARNFTSLGPESGSLIGWWRMGDNDSFPTITDLGSGGNNGTMTNMQESNIVGEVF